MIRNTSVVLIVCLLLGNAAQSQTILPEPPNIEASGFILMEAETGTILAEHNSHEQLPPASLTKIMTSYVVASELASGRMSMDETVDISVTAWKTEGSQMFIREGTEVSIADLLRGVIIQSGNDASVAIAEHVSGDEHEFSKLMNRYAAQLGLENTFFTNASGLPHPKHLTTAYDTLILTKALIENFPEHYKIYSEPEFTYDGITQPNRNRLLYLEDSVDGVKTGHTKEAGYCLVASAVRDNMRLISVVMGAKDDDSRNRETRKLLSYGYRNFELEVGANPDFEFDSLKVHKGVESEVSVRVREEIKTLLPRGSSSELKYSIEIPRSLEAPIATGDKIGTLNITFEDENIGSTAVYAEHDVAKIGFWGGIFNGIKSWFSTVPEEKLIESPHSIDVQVKVEDS